MIYNKDYFVKGEVAGALVVEEKDYSGNIVGVHSYMGASKGKFVLTLAWDGGRSSKTYDDFATAMRMANGHWARQAIWHITPSNSRKRVVRWQ
jgi:hypothetical protein